MTVISFLVREAGLEPSSLKPIPTENTTFLKFVSNFVSKNAL